MKIKEISKILPVIKKPYSPPRLVIYGDLQSITGAKGGKKRDGVSSRTRL